MTDESEDFLKDHLTKCRCCFKRFEGGEKKLKITKTIETVFQSVIQIELRASKLYSQSICRSCNNTLDEFNKFKRDVFDRQSRLYAFCEPLSKIQQVELIKTEQKNSKDVNRDDIKEEDGATALNTVIIERSDFSKGFSGSKKEIQLAAEQVVKKQSKRKMNFHCDGCKRNFHSADSYKSHLRAGHQSNVKIYGCLLEGCQFLSNTYFGIKSHNLTHIPESERRKYLQQKKREKLSGVCQLCGGFFKDVNHHTKVHTKPKDKICDLCGYATNIFKNLRRHMNRHQLPELKKIHTCSICSKAVSDLRSLKIHIKYVHEVEEKRFSCFCGKRYKRKTELQSHNRLFHQKMFNYHCSVCDKSFGNATYYKEHVETHENGGKASFCCSVCGSFHKMKSHLFRHMKKHREPTEKCPDPNCERIFHFKAMAVKHFQNIHLKLKTTCSQCGKTMLPEVYRKHVLEFHSNLERVCCKILGCNSTFKRRDNYRYHVKKKHLQYFERLNDEEKYEILHRKEFVI